MLHNLAEQFIEQWWPWIVAWVVVMVLLEALEHFSDHHKALKRLRELAHWGPAVVCAALLLLVSCMDRGWWWISLLFAVQWQVGADQWNARRLKAAADADQRARETEDVISENLKFRAIFGHGDVR
jgi:hypothetical protein